MVTTLAECNLMLEFNTLSYLLKNDTYAKKVNTIISTLDILDPPSGLYPTMLNISNGNISLFFGLTYTIGALADSFYEYLLKQWLQSGKTLHHLRQLYNEAVDGITKYLVRRSTPSMNLYVLHFTQGKFVDKMDHLSCFLPGMLALGAEGENKIRDFAIAERLMSTCVDMYTCQVSGLAPEIIKFEEWKDFAVEDARYMLRPETMESLFVLYRLTKSPKYRAAGWRIFKSLQTHCKTQSGFSGITDITKSVPPKDDVMQAFFMSETMKYLFLLFSNDDVLPLDQYVFNTEAHPFPIFKNT